MFCGIHLTAISQRLCSLLLCMSLKIILSVLLPHLPWANELTFLSWGFLWCQDINLWNVIGTYGFNITATSPCGQRVQAFLHWSVSLQHYHSQHSSIAIVLLSVPWGWSKYPCSAYFCENLVLTCFVQNILNPSGGKGRFFHICVEIGFTFNSFAPGRFVWNFR